MSRRCKTLLCLLQRSVSLAHVPSVRKTAAFVQKRPLSSAVRSLGVKSDYGTLSVLRTRCLSFSTKSPAEEEYPPVQDYPPVPEYPMQECPPVPASQSPNVFIVHVKGIPWSCTSEHILEFFSDCRIRDGEEGVHLLSDPFTGRWSGDALIELEHEEDIRKALDKDRLYLRSRYIEVSLVNNRDAEAMLRCVMDRDTVVFLRGLPYSSSAEDIVKFFSGLDIVENGVTIVRNRNGHSTGKAFVEFASVQAAKEALKKHLDLIGKRYIEVFQSQKKDIYSDDRLHAAKPAPTMESITNTPHRNANDGSPAPLSHFIRVSRMPVHASGGDIVRFFHPLLVTKVLLEFNSVGKPTGEADVYFQCHRDAVEAMSKNQMYIGGRCIQLYLNSVQGEVGQ